MATGKKRVLLETLLVLVLVVENSRQSGLAEDEKRIHSNRGNGPESFYEALESQQISLYTEVEYMPLDAGATGFKHHKTKEQNFDIGEMLKGQKSFENSIGFVNSNKGSNSKNHKAGHYKKGGKHLKGREHKNSHFGDNASNSKGRKGHAKGHDRHINKGKHAQGYQKVWHREESGRNRKFFDNADNMKYSSDHDHLLIHQEEAHKGGYEGGNKKDFHLHDVHGKKLKSKSERSHDDTHKEHKSYGDRKDYGKRSDYGDKSGHARSKGSSKGDPRVVHHQVHGSHSVLQVVKVAKPQKKTKQIPLRNVSDVHASPSDVSNVISEAKQPAELEFGRRTKSRAKSNRIVTTANNPKIPIRRGKSRLRNIPIKKTKVNNIAGRDAKSKTFKKIPTKIIDTRIRGTPVSKNEIHNPKSSANISPSKQILNKTLKKIKAKNTVPVSIFVKEKKVSKKPNKLKKKELKIKQGKYGGHINDVKNHPKKSRKVPVKQNEIVNSKPKEFKEVATTVDKPKVVSKPRKKAFASKKRVVKKLRRVLKPKTVSIPPLKKQKSHQVSVVSNKKLKPSAYEKKSNPKPKSYKKSKAHESSFHKTTGKSVKKGGHEESGFKGKHFRDHGKKLKSKFADKGKKKYKGHNHKKHYDGRYKGGKKQSKGHAHGSKGHHHKGHSDKGFKDVHHKFEYAEKKNFYHEDADKKYHKVFDEFDALFQKKMKENVAAINHDHANHGNHYGHEGYHHDDHFHHHGKGHKGNYGHSGHHKHHNHYGHQKHHEGKQGHHKHHGHNPHGNSGGYGGGHGHHGHLHGGGISHHGYGHGGGHGIHGHGGSYGYHGHRHGGSHGHLGHGHGGGYGHHGFGGHNQHGHSHHGSSGGSGGHSHF